MSSYRETDPNMYREFIGNQNFGDDTDAWIINGLLTDMFDSLPASSDEIRRMANEFVDTYKTTGGLGEALKSLKASVEPFSSNDKYVKSLYDDINEYLQEYLQEEDKDKDEWEGLDAFRDSVNSKPKYLRKAIDILSRSKGYTNADVESLADSIDRVSHGYGISGRLPEKDARENWLDFIKRENAEGILSPDDFYYGDEPEEEDYSNNSPTGIANPADYMSIVQEDTDNDGDIDKVSIEEKNEED